MSQYRRLIKRLNVLVVSIVYALTILPAYSSNQFNYESYCSKIHILLQKNTHRHQCLKQGFDFITVEKACGQYECHHTEGCSVSTEDYHRHIKNLNDSMNDVTIDCLKQWGVITTAR